MKQTTTEVINKLTIEYNELAGRIGSLERFMTSADFQQVGLNQHSLLLEQIDIMEMYKKTLLKRLLDLRSQEDREKIRTGLEKVMPCAPAEEESRAPMCKCVKIESEDLNGTPTD